MIQLELVLSSSIYRSTRGVSFGEEKLMRLSQVECAVTISIVKGCDAVFSRNAKFPDRGLMGHFRRSAQMGFTASGSASLFSVFVGGW